MKCVVVDLQLVYGIMYERLICKDNVIKRTIFKYKYLNESVHRTRPTCSLMLKRKTLNYIISSLIVTWLTTSYLQL